MPCPEVFPPEAISCVQCVHHEVACACVCTLSSAVVSVSRLDPTTWSNGTECCGAGTASRTPSHTHTHTHTHHFLLQCHQQNMVQLMCILTEEYSHFISHHPLLPPHSAPHLLLKVNGPVVSYQRLQHLNRRVYYTRVATGQHCSTRH